MGLLKDKVALITGASRGIGRGIAGIFGKNGCSVAFTYNNNKVMADSLKKELSQLNIKVKSYKSDASNFNDSQKLVDEVLKDFGSLDILVNNVGASPSRNFLYMTDEDWQELHELNLLSAVRCTRAFLPAMRENKWGRVVMISSSAGKYPNAALIDYGATKAAMISISKSLAKKYGSDGVLINSVLPGLIHTAMWERAATEIAEATGGKMEDVIKANGSSVPVGRYGTSEEVASLVTFLCSEAASYISGTSIEVDGGQAGHI